MDGFVFSTMPNNLTIENNDTFLASLMDNILVLYQNRAYSSIVGEVNIERNTVNAVGYIGTFSTTEHLATTHLINDNSNDSLTNYSEKSWSAWGSLDGTTGTLIRSGNKFNNIHSAGLTTGDKKHGNTIDLTIHQELRGKWVWFGMWTNDQGDSTGIQIFIDDETSLGVAPAGGLSTWQFQSTLQYIDPAATTLTYGFKLIGTSSAGQLVNNPVLAVVGNKYDDFPNDIAIRELSAAIPTVGTYDDNEVVWNSAAAVGAPAAWSCTTAGDLAGAGVLTAWANL